jgi:penicillin-binding protein 2
MRDPAFWKAIASAETRPMFDRATSAALPPGSVFKAVTAAALLDSRRINPDEPFECAGYLNRKDRHRDYIFRHFGVGHGPTTMNSALAQSCNVYFFHTAKILGAEPIISWAERFGFGRPTGIDLPSETAGHVPMNSRSADSLGIAIGQADLTASPLQVVRAMAAIANGGRLVTPHVVRGSGPQAGGSSVRPLLRSDPVPRLTSDMLVRLREALEQVVSHPLGSGYKSVRHPKIAIAGKTGTAEVGGDLPDHAWFAGYAPADDPMVAFVVLLENAGSGGQSAGPVARQTVETLDRLGFLNDSP